MRSLDLSIKHMLWIESMIDNTILLSLFDRRQVEKSWFTGIYLINRSKKCTFDYDNHKISYYFDNISTPINQNYAHDCRIDRY